MSQPTKLSELPWQADPAMHFATRGELSALEKRIGEKLDAVTAELKKLARWWQPLLVLAAGFGMGFGQAAFEKYVEPDQVAQAEVRRNHGEDVLTGSMGAAYPQP